MRMNPMIIECILRLDFPLLSMKKTTSEFIDDQTVIQILLSGKH